MHYSDLRDHLLARFSKYSQDIMELTKMASKSDIINPRLYEKYDVKRGLRDINGNGVVCGLTEISEIVAFGKDEDGNKIPVDGQLYYRGYNIRDLVKGAAGRRFDFEEATYLLLFGHLPTKSQFERFCEILADFRSLPPSFVRDIIMKAPSKDMMNTLARSILTLYSYDDRADDVSLPNVLRQCLQLISLCPMLTIYGYQAYSHYHDGNSLFIHQPLTEGSMAENILHILRPDSSYTPLEARILDICMILHMEHGGGNNSSFTTHVVTSSLTDTYSVMAAAIGSLKGPRHGGANIKVIQMFEDMKSEVKDWADEDEVAHYLQRLLNKDAFDHAGLIYGVGHAVYSKSDPRAIVLKSFVEKLSEEKGLHEEFELYNLVEKLAPKVISGERQMYKGVSVNVDFYSGFVYKMLGLPTELFTPIFAIARMVGWGAHRMEELANNGKIIRPAYKSICADKEYVSLADR